MSARIAEIATKFYMQIWMYCKSTLGNASGPEMKHLSPTASNAITQIII